ncbi:hypothetical protein Tco_0903136 [Tanacetum coccineum]
MNPVVTQQVALHNALVAPDKRLKIKRCNARIEFSKPQNEATYQVTLETLKLTPCYPAFLKSTYINSGTPSKRSEIQMHTISSLIRRNVELTLNSFELGYSRKCDMLSAIHTDQMHQPRRIFAAIINWCISRKITGLDRLRESRAQILWGYVQPEEC